MHLAKILLPSLLLACTAVGFAQPAEPPKKESSLQALLRMRAEGRVRAVNSLRKELSKYNIGEDDQNMVAMLVGAEDAQRTLIRRAYYELEVAEEAGVDDEQYAIFWQDFQKLCEQHRAQRAQNAKTLMDKLQLGQKPRLQAYLTFHGIIGDEVPFLMTVSETASNASSRIFDIEREVKQPKRVVAPDEKPNG